MKQGTTFILALVSVLLLSTQLFAAENRDFFKVGVVTSISGELATGGNVTKRGYDLWAQAVNAQGGIEINGKKYPVQLFYADAQSQPSQGAASAERLITQEKVDFILGPYSSGVTMAAAPVVEKYKVPMITGSAESPLIWLNKFKYTFGTIPPVSFTGATPITTLSALPDPPKTAVIFGSNDTFSKATAEAFKAAAEKAGIKVRKYNIVPAGQDLTPLMSAVRGLRPDLVAFGGHDEELIKLVKSLQQINYTPKALLMHYGVTEPAFIEALGKNADQVYGASVWTATAKTRGEFLWPDAASYAAAAEKAYKAEADYTQAGSSAAGIAYQAALQKIGATPPLSEAERVALVQALENLDIETFYGRINFADEGDYYHANVGMTPLTIQIQNQKVVVVGPDKDMESAPQYPMISWEKR
ncbi:MAG: amino acid ABC transporter substrate-binding protein [Desulfuromonadales bacterium]